MTPELKEAYKAALDRYNKLAVVEDLALELGLDDAAKMIHNMRALPPQDFKSVTDLLLESPTTSENVKALLRVLEYADYNQYENY